MAPRTARTARTDVDDDLAAAFARGDITLTELNERASAAGVAATSAQRVDVDDEAERGAVPIAGPTPS